LYVQTNVYKKSKPALEFRQGGLANGRYVFNYEAEFKTFSGPWGFI
jgi:hypothetical protein